jgi:hypothetical protein
MIVATRRFISVNSLTKCSPLRLTTSWHFVERTLPIHHVYYNVTTYPNNVSIKTHRSPFTGISFQNSCYVLLILESSLWLFRRTDWMSWMLRVIVEQIEVCKWSTKVYCSLMHHMQFSKYHFAILLILTVIFRNCICLHYEIIVHYVRIILHGTWFCNGVIIVLWPIILHLCVSFAFASKPWNVWRKYKCFC